MLEGLEARSLPGSGGSGRSGAVVAGEGDLGLEHTVHNVDDAVVGSNVLFTAGVSL